MAKKSLCYGKVVAIVNPGYSKLIRIQFIDPERYFEVKA
jgi:hypothetical protein